MTAPAMCQNLSICRGQCLMVMTLIVAARRVEFWLYADVP
jgi:hypothetical protein